MAKAKKQQSKKQSNRKKRPQKATITRSQILYALAIIAGVTFIAYIPVLSAGFVDIDDYKLILNKGRRFLNNPMSVYDLSFGHIHWKPVTYTTWMLEYRAVGENPFLYHFNNLLLHIANCILVFFLSLRIVPKFDRLKDHLLPIAFFTALLFGVHPMHVESVSWIVERKDVLYTFFYLLGLIAYVRYLDTGKVLPLLLSAGAYFLSIFSKSPGVTMLGVLFLLDIVWQRKFSARLIYEKAAHLFVLLFALYGFGIFSKGRGEGKIGSLGEEQVLARASNVQETPTLYGKAMLGSMRAWLWYIHSWLPFRTSLGYPREAIISFFGPLIHLFPILFAGAGAFLLWVRKSKPMLFFGHAFFVIALLPAIARLGLGIGIFMSDRYVYLSLFGLLLWAVSALLTTGEKGFFNAKFKMGLLGAIALVFAIATFNGARVWKSTETLWTNVIEKYPSVAYAYVNRGSYYREQGAYEKALADLQKAIQLEDNANARIQLGLIKRQGGDAAGAIADYTKAIAFEPKNTQAYVNRGNAYLDTGQFQKAISDFDFVLSRERNEKAATNRGIAFAQLGQFAKAEESFDQAFRMGGQRNPDFYLNRAIMRFNARKYQESIQDYRKFLEFKPQEHQVMNDLAVVYQILNDHNRAVELLTQAIALSPSPVYFENRAKSYASLGNAQAAEQDRQRAKGKM